MEYLEVSQIVYVQTNTVDYMSNVIKYAVITSSHGSTRRHVRVIKVWEYIRSSDLFAALDSSRIVGKLPVFRIRRPRTTLSTFR